MAHIKGHGCQIRKRVIAWSDRAGELASPDQQILEGWVDLITAGRAHDPLAEVVMGKRNVRSAMVCVDSGASRYRCCSRDDVGVFSGSIRRWSIEQIHLRTGRRLDLTEGASE